MKTIKELFKNLIRVVVKKRVFGVMHDGNRARGQTYIAASRSLK